MRIFVLCLILSIVLHGCATNGNAGGKKEYFRRNDPDSKAGFFWTWFQKHEREIYDVKTADEPILTELQAELNKVSPDLKFKLGWSQAYNRYGEHQFPAGLRQLAISSTYCDEGPCYSAQSVILHARMGNAPWYNFNSGDMMQISDRWVIVKGQHPRARSCHGWLESGKHGTQKIDFGNTHCVAKRGVHGIDLTVYTDLPMKNDPWQCDWLKWSQKENRAKYRNRALEQALGDYYFRYILGDVIIAPLCEKPQTASRIDDAGKLFDQLVTKEEAARRDEIVCDRDVFFTTRIFDYGRGSRSWYDCYWRIGADT